MPFGPEPDVRSWGALGGLALGGLAVTAGLLGAGFTLLGGVLARLGRSD